MESRDMPPPTLHRNRSNTDLNISVLRRYLPGIQTILSIAANAVVYNFSFETQGWEKHGVEGTMFVCQQEPIVMPSGQTLPQYCVFVLNRRGMNNVVVDLVKVKHCEETDGLIVFQLEDDAISAPNGNDEESVAKNVVGIWIHADEADRREVNATVIRVRWQEARQALDSLYQTGAAAGQRAEMEDGASVGGTHAEGQGQQTGYSGGRQISIADLFGQKSGNG